MDEIDDKSIVHKQVIGRMDSTTAATGQTVEKSVEVPGTDAVIEPRAKTNPLQCQLCCKVFPTRNALFTHFKCGCLRGKLVRIGRDDREHRRRWRARQTLRKPQAAGVGQVFQTITPAEQRRGERAVEKAAKAEAKAQAEADKTAATAARAAEKAKAAREATEVAQEAAAKVGVSTHPTPPHALSGFNNPVSCDLRGGSSPTTKIGAKPAGNLLAAQSGGSHLRYNGDVSSCSRGLSAPSETMPGMPVGNLLSAVSGGLDPRYTAWLNSLSDAQHLVPEKINLLPIEQIQAHLRARGLNADGKKYSLKKRLRKALLKEKARKLDA